MPEIEKMVRLLKELTPENQLIAMGGILALKAKQDTTG